jgi:hypothetical protein
MLRVAVERLLIAPLRPFLRRLGICFCFKRLVPLVELEVVGVIEVEVRQLELDAGLRRGHRLWLRWWLQRPWWRAATPA